MNTKVKVTGALMAFIFGTTIALGAVSEAQAATRTRTEKAIHEVIREDNDKRPPHDRGQRPPEPPKGGPGQHHGQPPHHGNDKNAPRPPRDGKGGPNGQQGERPQPPRDNNGNQPPQGGPGNGDMPNLPDQRD